MEIAWQLCQKSAVYSGPLVSIGGWFQDSPLRYQNPQMLKSFIENGMAFAYKLNLPIYFKSSLGYL